MTTTKRAFIRRAVVGPVSALSLGLAMAATAAHAADQRARFDIPAQPLSQALAEFSRQSKANVLAPSSLTRGRTSAPVSGDLTPEEALKQLLGDTPLKVQRQADGSMIIASAVIQGARDNGGGPGRLARVETRASRPTAADDQAEQAEEDEIHLEEMVVTGTNIRGVVNPTTPVLSFDRQDIELTGAATVEDFLRTIPQNFGSVTPSSFNSGNPFAEEARVPSTAVDLRGVGAGATLVLLNGRRLSPASNGFFVDVSTLPLGVIDRIDVLTDGASAVYGSDAVAGVVNFVTKADFDGLEARARYGTVTDGGLDEVQFGVTGGTTWGSGGAFVSVEYTDRKPLLVADRAFADPVISENPEASLFPEFETFAVLGSFSQEITDKIVFSTDIIYGRRETFNNPIFFLRRDRNKLDSLTVNTNIRYDISETLSVSLFYDYSQTESESTDSRNNFEGPPSVRGNSLSIVEGQVSGSLLDLPAGRVSFAAGVMYRDEENTAGSDGLATREVTAFYGEVLVPIIGTGNAVPLIQNLDLSLAGRYEDYSDFGDTFNPKIGLHWALTDQLALRGTYSEAFRAPTLSDGFVDEQVLFFSAPASLMTVAPPPPQNPRLPDGQLGFLLLTGDAALTEERADIFSSGLEYQPSFAPGLRIEASYFDISYRDRVESVEPLPILQNDIFSSFIELNPDPNFIATQIARQNEQGLRFDFFFPIPIEDVRPDDIQIILRPGLRNLARRQIRGLDFLLHYDRDTDWGTFSSSVNATYLLDYRIGLNASDTLDEEVDTLFRPIDLRLRGTLSWSQDGVTVFAAVNYADNYRDFVGGKIDAWTTVDLTLAYDSSDRFGNPWLNNIRAGLSVQNLFDEDPPFVRTLDGFNFDAANASALGRFLSFQITKAW